MASSEEEKYLYVSSGAYQTLVQHAAHSYAWSQYFLLINACSENLKRLPEIPEQCSEEDIEHLLIKAMERLADAITFIMPEGIHEFQSYLTRAAHKHRLLEMVTLKKLRCNR